MSQKPILQEMVAVIVLALKLLSSLTGTECISDAHIRYKMFQILRKLVGFYRTLDSYNFDNHAIEIGFLFFFFNFDRIAAVKMQIYALLMDESSLVFIRSYDWALKG